MFSDDLPKKKPPLLYKPSNPDTLAYLDFSVSTTGMLAGVKVHTHISVQLIWTFVFSHSAPLDTFYLAMFTPYIILHHNHNTKNTKASVMNAVRN